MPKFTIPVFWSVAADMEIEAECLEEAIKIAYQSQLPPEEDREYIDDSFTVNAECAEALAKDKEE
jgi:hypothetical protein